MGSAEFDRIAWDGVLRYHQTEDNHDKFYVIQLLEGKAGTDYYVWQRWGRAGTTGQSTLKGPSALAVARAEFAAKFKDKTKNVFGAGAFTPQPGKYIVVNDVPAPTKAPAKAAAAPKAKAAAAPKATMAAPPSEHRATTSSGLFLDDLMDLSGDGDSRGGDADVGDIVEVEDDDGASYKATVVEVFKGKRNGGGLKVRDNETGEIKRLKAEDLEEMSLDVIESPRFTTLWETHQQQLVPVPDGVAYVDGAVPPELVAALHADIDRLIAVEPEDYHPGSGTRVRDLVHPSLFPYVQGRSVRQTAAAPAAAAPATPAAPEKRRSGRQPAAPPATAVAAPAAPEYDRFGRKYEASRYQWLPTPFHIDEHGGVTIPTYINNLSRERHPDTYTHLSSLFALALPYIESVVGYVDRTTFYDDSIDDGVRDHDKEKEMAARENAGAPVPPTSLRGRDLLVIPKIVEYQLQPGGEAHEGVWHVEGMSHEHIVATCVYVLSRDAALEGGDLLFKRAYTFAEGSTLFWNVPQDRPTAFNDMVEEGTIPIGRVPTPAGRLLVFPNSHIHKLTKLAIATAVREAQRRRVIVFWIVDPAVTDMPSTRDVAPQQESVFSREEALAMRLELMEERKRHKQNLNVRAVSLCEH